MTASREDIDDALYLMKRSDYHSWYGTKQINDYIRPPMFLDQFIVLRDEGRVPLVFATWGFPDYEQVVQYTETGVFPPDGFDAGGKDPWLIDFIAEGGPRNIALGFRKLKSVLSNKGYSQAFWFRTETEKLGFHQWGKEDG